MDTTKMLEENITLKLNTLETLTLSLTTIFAQSLVDFLINENGVYIVKVQKDGEESPDFEQTGMVMLKSTLESLKNIRQKIWESGRVEIGENVPEELEDITSVYSRLLNEIISVFLKNLMS